MPKSIVIKDFSGGWQPAINQLNGPPNGFLFFDGADLDETGAVRAAGDLAVFHSGYDGVPQTLWSSSIAGVVYNYISTSAGSVYQNTTRIINATGSATRAAFAAAFGYIFICTGTQFKKTDSVTLQDIGLIVPLSAPTVGATAAGNLTGSYQWMQVYVAENQNGYTVLSAGSPLTAIQNLTANNQALTLLDPTSPEPRATHVYVFRRGGTLDQFYFVGKVTAGTTAFTDNLADSDALAINIIYNTFIMKANSTNVVDPVMDMIGLVYGRMLYFTAKNIFISRINCPDVFDSRTTIGFAGSAGAEIFLFAKKLGENIVLVGTNLDLYLISGTFQELAPGVLDVYLRPLGVPNPPIGIYATIWNQNIVYMSASGWVMYSPTLGYLQGQTNLTSGTTDRLYFETSTVNGFSPVKIILPQDSTGVITSGPANYPCCTSNNKLFIVDPLGSSTYRLVIYDFIRKYWKTLGLINTFGTLFTAQDGTVLVGDLTNSVYTYVKNPGVSAANGFRLSTVYLDNGEYNVRKDPLGFRIRCNATHLTVRLALDESNAYTTIGTVISGAIGETFIDLGPNGHNIATFKSIQVFLGDVSGFATPLTIEDFSIDYEPRPAPLMYYQDLAINVPDQLHGVWTRPRVWPITIDTLGHDVTVRPLINGALNASAPAITINHVGKKTILYQFLVDIPALIDLGIRIETTTANPFELWKVGIPTFVQVLPIAKQFDQLGPSDLFRWGRIKALRFRLFCDGGTTLPYNIYFADSSVETGNITVVANVEDTYEIVTKRTDGGHILKIELGGPALGFNFYRYYVQAQVNRLGRDTEYEWVPLGAEENAQ